MPADAARGAGVNARLDMIVRQPFSKEDERSIPIGVVSKDYVLVQHEDVVKAATEALKVAGIKTADVDAELAITEYGERMALSLYLPAKYSFDPGDGNPMGMRLECINSVDGSTRFRAMMGWFRFVCSNGLVVGVTQSDVRRRHVGDLSSSDVGRVLAAGLENAQTERDNFRKWRGLAIKPERLAAWVEKDLKDRWGFKAATRAYHIARRGSDVEITGKYEGATPTTILTRDTLDVPGCPDASKNLFDVSQVLAWLAKERRDLQEQLEWREEIPALLEPLMKN